jgi:hypothetical protein
MKEPIEVTYTKTIELDEYSQNYLEQDIYDAFTSKLSDYLDGGDVDTVPGGTLKKIFAIITKNMLDDDEFWGD